MTLKDVEQRLETLLQKLILPQPITIADIRDIIWNAADTKNSSRLFLHLTEYASDEETRNEILQLSQDAWNYFPHRMLGGKSPYDLITESQQSGTVTKPPPLPKKGKTLSDVFEDQYPKTITFTKLSDDTWGWEFPKLYHELTEQLWELEESRTSVEVLEKELYRMIKQMPMLFDAVNRLAQLYGIKREFGLAKTLYEQTIKTARSYIPKTFIPGTDRAIWPYLENRPFLRLLAGYAMFVEEFERREKAIPLYEEILAFNPNDNQGIRSILATAYLKTNQPEKVIKLASHYPEGGMAELNIGTLLAYLMLNKKNQAMQLFKDIKKWHPNIIKEILKPTHHKPATMIDDRITMGGTDEAYAYWQAQGALWDAIPEAKTFLKENASEIAGQIITLTDKDVLDVPIFHDFLAFLNYLKEKPIKRTATGNISIKALQPFLETLQTMQPIVASMKEYGWRIRTEDEAQSLHMLKVITDIMRLTRNQRDKLLITKNGMSFLQNLTPVEQYRQLVDHYWHRLNWGYFAGYSGNHQASAKSFQRDQTRIWNILASRGTAWIDYKGFCEILRDELHLKPHLQESYANPDEILEKSIYNTLFTHNLVLFNCVEIETKPAKYGGKDIIRFRSTKLGLAMYQNT